MSVMGGFSSDEEGVDFFLFYTEFNRLTSYPFWRRYYEMQEIKKMSRIARMWCGGQQQQAITPLLHGSGEVRAVRISRHIVCLIDNR